MVIDTTEGARSTVCRPSILAIENTCTPRYYNGEGKNEGQAFLRSRTLKTRCAFKMLADWREQGDLEDLIEIARDIRNHEFLSNSCHPSRLPRYFGV